jgi:hypothetical protein
MVKTLYALISTTARAQLQAISDALLCDHLLAFVIPGPNGVAGAGI